MQEKPIKRLYYSIAEVSEITGLKQYVLRYWETEFPELKPRKNRAGNRIYKKSDIQLLFTIQRLLYQDKYTTEGARQKLKTIKIQDEATLPLSLEEDDGNTILQDIRNTVQYCLDLLNKEL